MKTGRNSTIWPLFGEFVVALAAFAFLALSFGQVTPANSVLSSAKVAALESQDFCGNGSSGDASDHSGACHACRMDAQALPPAPCIAEPAFARLAAATVPVTFAPLPEPATPSFWSRAPPVPV